MLISRGHLSLPGVEKSRKSDISKFIQEIIFRVTRFLKSKGYPFHYGDGTLFDHCCRLHNVIWLSSDKLSHVWVRLFLKKLKIDTTKDRTLADWTPVYHLTTITTKLMANVIYTLATYINSTIVIYEILRKNKKRTLHRNQFFTLL